LATAGRERLIAEGQTLAEAMAGVLASYHRIGKVLKGRVQPDWLPALADIREQLDRLIFPGFIATCPPRWLTHYPRYMQAIERRLEKLRGDPPRDRRIQQEMSGVWQGFWQRFPPDGEQRPESQEMRWLLEELRVSLFAQELGTVAKVSVKRLSQ
jgi:ATP-dependent helicase HrpA